MVIGIVSDTHGSLSWWEEAWNVIKGSDLAIHCGDLRLGSKATRLTNLSDWDVDVRVLKK